MYKIYASKIPTDATRAQQGALMVSFEFEEFDAAAQQCVDLVWLGFTVHKVALPAGVEIAGEVLEQTMNIKRLNPSPTLAAPYGHEKAE